MRLFKMLLAFTKKKKMYSKMPRSINKYENVGLHEKNRHD